MSGVRKKFNKAFRKLSRRQRAVVLALLDANYCRECAGVHAGKMPLPTRSLDRD